MTSFEAAIVVLITLPSTEAGYNIFELPLVFLEQLFGRLSALLFYRKLESIVGSWKL